MKCKNSLKNIFDKLLVSQLWEFQDFSFINLYLFRCYHLHNKYLKYMVSYTVKEQETVKDIETGNFNL